LLLLFFGIIVVSSIIFGIINAIHCCNILWHRIRWCSIV